MPGKQNEALQESYVLQDNSAMLEMLRQRGATEAKCALPKLRELLQDPTSADLGCGVGTITAFLAMSASQLCDGKYHWSESTKMKIHLLKRRAIATNST